MKLLNKTKSLKSQVKIYYKIMLSYCCKYKKTENKYRKVSKTSVGKTMLLSKYAARNSKKSRFIEKQEASGLLSKLGIKITQIPLNKILILVDVLFFVLKSNNALMLYNMNKIVNKFLLAGAKFLPEMQLKQPQFTHNACGRLEHNKKKNTTEEFNFYYVLLIFLVNIHG